MALEENGGNGMVMPVAPFYGNGNGNNGFGGDWGWIILLLLFAGGGWGGNGFGGGYDFPWLLNGQNGINANISNGFQNALLNDNVTSIRDNMFALQSQFAESCCENRLASCQTQNLVSNEANATRANATANTQAILDKLCSLELDAKNEKIADLERQLTMSNLAASQNAQTSRILADNAAQTLALEQYLNPTPVPAYVVQNPNCCSNNNGCGCSGF